MLTAILSKEEWLKKKRKWSNKEHTLEEKGNIQFSAELEREEIEKEGEKILHPKVKLNCKRHLIVGSKLGKK